MIEIIVTVLFTGWVYLTKTGPRRKYKVDLTGKIVIITGSSAGVGKETARKLARHGATIIFACRNKAKTLTIIKEIKSQTKNNNLHFIQLELSNYESTKQFVKTFKQQFNKVDILINNAGIATWRNEVNVQDHNTILATNYFGHFLLTYLLLPYFSDRSKIINVSSGMHHIVRKKPNFKQLIFEQNSLYIQAISKYAIVLFSQYLQKKCEGQNRNIKVVSLNPGWVRSEIMSYKNYGILGLLFKVLIHTFGYMFTLSEEEGSWTTVYTALQPYEELVSGGYYEKNKLSKASKLARSGDQEEELWQLSLKELELL